ncbi:caspase family protein [Niastella populi]|uniref:Peptidase C14 caspase domain-containing protein n=1 Tax=Niastella populi TaxID=550983 RepID=A0A1V9F0R5_9BACT|nr:caspase family protein [Niastella populi]OQP51895.1 hypothetical protein A4R26_29190 [Niastella populi]
MISTPFQYDLSRNGGGAAPLRKYYLLAIAIDNYGNGFDRLANPVTDANRIVKLLVEDYNFNKTANTDLRTTNPSYDRHEEVIPVYTDTQDYLTNCLYNEAATKTAIIETVEHIYEKIGPDDALLIYFAGHGVKGSNDQYYLVCADSQNKRGTWLNIHEIYSQFDKYPDKRKCRDLLLVLDACYSGLSALGTATSVSGDFSRFLLTSTSDQQVADDGISGRGSGFANAFHQYLEENTNPYLAFAEGPIRAKFELSMNKGDETQKIRYVQIPGVYGQRAFIFERKEKDKPKIEDLKESFIEHLDFEDYRSIMGKDYKNALNSLNIIITQGYSLNVQKVGWKVLFRWLSRPGRGLNFDRPELHLMLDPIKIETTEGDIWKTLYNQIKRDTDGPPIDKSIIHDWYFEKLMSGDERYAGKRHVILWIYFTVGGKEKFDRIQEFCEEFSALFLHKVKQLSEEEKKALGKMFIFFSDERDNSEAYLRDRFTKVTNKDKFNLIATPIVDPISSNHISDWVDQVTRLNQTKLIQALKDPRVVKTMVERPECEDFDCHYEDFIRYVCAHCRYSETERTQLNQYLFDFTKSII